MKKTLVILGIVLVIGAIKPATTRYRAQISQYCGESVPANFQAEQRADWIWQWWPHRETERAFIVCVGPAEYVSYRPLDVAGVMVVTGLGLVWAGIRRKHG